MPNAKDYRPSQGALMLSVLGPPGTGKSYLIRSAAEVGKLAVALSPAAELDGYSGWDVDYEVFEDLLWKPHVNKYEASAFNRLLKWIEKQAAADVKTIGVDSMSVVSDLIMHEALKMHGTDNPMDLEYGRAFYAHNGMMKQLLQVLQQARSAGKHVICSWHVTMKETEGLGTPTKVIADKRTKEERWKFEENMLPTMHGSMRQDVGKWFSLWLYTDMQGFGPGTRYFVSALPNKARPAKKRIEFKEGVNPARLANDFKTIVEAIR